MRLQTFDNQIIHCKGKDHVAPDMLSRLVPVVFEVTPENSTDRWWDRISEKVANSPRKCSDWRLENEKLFRYVSNRYSDFLGHDTCWKEVPPKPDRKAVVAASHEPTLIGHFGIGKTTDRFGRRYYYTEGYAHVLLILN